VKPYYAALLALLLLFACAPERQQKIESSLPLTDETLAPAVEIQPLEATRETTFYIGSKGIDFSKAKIQWLVNDIPVVGASATQFRASEIKKGDRVEARVFIGNQEMASNQITVKNIPPAIVRSKIIPHIPRGDDILKAEVVASDRDGDEVSLLYKWSKNGVPYGTGKTLEGPFTRGDKISLKITPFDGDDLGQTVVLTIEICNAPPRPSGGEGRLDNDVYLYQIRAVDPDGDALIYDLKEAPEGMVIEKSTGVISWKLSEENTGRHPVSVKIADGHGGEVLYPLEVTVKFE